MRFMTTNPLRTLREYGQSVWLDFVSRELLKSGKIETLVAEDGLSGVTSNPSIFEKAIGEGEDYDEEIGLLLADGDIDAGQLFERLAVSDIREGADTLRPVYDATHGRDGYISLEVSPYLAMETEKTVAEVERLWREVGRPNLMVKIPATGPGLPAIERMIGKGININVTLLFSQKVYEEVAAAYIAGIEQFSKSGGDPQKVASVASFFVSRIDTLADKALDERIAQARDESEKKELEGLKGRVAIANARLAYRLYKRIFSGERWQRLAQRGARSQRLLWASTSTKNKAYRDVLYVEELVGADTVNTIPPATMEAFREHGRVRASLDEDPEDAERVLAALARHGISLDGITRALVEDGVRLFAEAADQLYAAVARKRRRVLGPRLNAFRAHLPADIDAEAKARLEDWRAGGKGRRLWSGDARLWTGRDEGDWLGWLDIAAAERQEAKALQDFAAEVAASGFRDVLLLGMGGSSLGAEVIGESVPQRPGFPRLTVLDSTDPAQIRRVESAIELSRALFIVSSKSGTTLEPNILKDYFFARAASLLGEAEARQRFVAITDKGSSLAEVARGFRRIFRGEKSIGGRYSVLSNFGMVPAAAIGVDIEAILAGAERMARSCSPATPPAENPGVFLGAILGAAAAKGRDKVTIIASAGIAAFGAWLEQLLAESTGKEGKGVIPLAAEPLGPPEVYGTDRLFAVLTLAGEEDAEARRALSALEAAGHPVVEIAVSNPLQLGQEFFRWEMATAVLGSILGINPFDQPDVEAQKVKSRELTAAYEKTGALPPEEAVLAEEGVRLYADPSDLAFFKEKAANLAGALKAHFARAEEGDYVALLPYIDRSPAHIGFFRDLRQIIRDHLRCATCLGFGPRFLHSTGQAYKGGPNRGLFLQITGETADDLPIPGRVLGFGVVERAQARGDLAALRERGRRALGVHLEGDLEKGLAKLKRATLEALS
jgi:transaldolase / glucose-6-phosphate isomerase